MLVVILYSITGEESVQQPERIGGASGIGTHNNCTRPNEVVGKGPVKMAAVPVFIFPFFFLVLYLSICTVGVVFFFFFFYVTLPFPFYYFETRPSCKQLLPSEKRRKIFRTNNIKQCRKASGSECA